MIDLTFIQGTIMVISKQIFIETKRVLFQLEVSRHDAYVIVKR